MRFSIRAGRLEISCAGKITRRCRAAPHRCPASSQRQSRVLNREIAAYEDAAAAISDATAAVAQTSHAMLPGGFGFGQPDLRGGGAADAKLARPEREARAQERTADDDELRIHSGTSV